MSGSFNFNLTHRPIFVSATASQFPDQHNRVGSTICAPSRAGDRVRACRCLTGRKHPTRAARLPRPTGDSIWTAVKKRRYFKKLRAIAGRAVELLDRSPFFGVSITLKKRIIAARGVPNRHTVTTRCSRGFRAIPNRNIGFPCYGLIFAQTLSSRGL